MTRLNHTRRLALMEEAVTVLFCLIDDAYAHLNPNARRYESPKRLSDSGVITLALFQQLRGTESQRSFLRDTDERFFSHLFPGIAGLLSLLIESTLQEAAVLLGTLASGRGERVGR